MMRSDTCHITGAPDSACGPPWLVLLPRAPSRRMTGCWLTGKLFLIGSLILPLIW